MSLSDTSQRLSETGQWAKQQLKDNPRWKADRDIWAIGLLLSGLVAWLDWHPPEQLTLAVAYLLIRGVQLLRRKQGRRQG